MHDPRIRLFGTVLLTISSFISIWGALLSVLWWFVTTKRTTSFQSFRSLALVFMLPVMASGAIYLSGGDGLSYLIRIGAVILIASWAYSERYQGEFLDVSVWLLGERIGFDIGLIGEMSLASAEVMSDDVRRILIALNQKNQCLSLQTIPPIIFSFLIRQLLLSQQKAAILALRGYEGGGTLCPRFMTPFTDIVAGAATILILTVSLSG